MRSPPARPESWTRSEALRNLKKARQFASDSQAAAADELKGVAVELVSRFGFHPVKAESTAWRAVERLTPTDADPGGLAHAGGCLTGDRMDVPVPITLRSSGDPLVKVGDPPSAPAET